MSSSEIASLRTQMRLEYEAGYQALHGLAVGTARHEFINRGMERMGECYQRMCSTLTGEEQAGSILHEIWEGQAE